MPHTVYLAGSVPKSKEDKENFVDWRVEFEKEVKRLLMELNINSDQGNIIFLDPNTADYDLMPTEKYFGRDVHMLKMSDAIVMDARHRPGIGTSQELLIAKYYHKPTIVVCPKGSYYHKTIQTNKSNDFHYIHPFITATSDVIVESFEQAAKVFLDHVTGRKKIIPKTIDLIESSRKDYEDNFMQVDEYLNSVLEKIRNK